MTIATLPVTQGKADSEAIDDGMTADDFSVFYRAEYSPLVHYLIKCGASLDDAKDGAQHAFIALYQRWKDVSFPRAWLRKVAFRIFLQDQKRNEQPLDEQDIHSSAASSASIELKEQTQTVIAAFRCLPLTQRQVMALYFDEFTIGEISEILGMTNAAVRQNLTRARGRLKIELGLDRPRWQSAA